MKFPDTVTETFMILKTGLLTLLHNTIRCVPINGHCMKNREEETNFQFKKKPRRVAKYGAHDNCFGSGRLTVK
jgi:hypothetical protein